jgi:hypothetical protein
MSPVIRFHYKIMVLMRMADEMNPAEWGKKQENDRLTPIMTQNNAVSDKLLKMIHCNCVGDANLPDADAMDSPALLNVVLARLQTVTIQKHSRAQH